MNKKSAALLASILVAPVLALGLTMKDVSAGPGALTQTARQVEPPTSMAELAIDEGMSEEAAVPDEGASRELSLEPQVNCRIESMEGIRWKHGFPQYNMSIGAHNLSGKWGIATIVQNDDSLTVFMPGRGPFLGQFYGPYSISVAFHDDPGCCTAQVTNAGQVLRWSNGTQWIKDT